MNELTVPFLKNLANSETREQVETLYEEFYKSVERNADTLLSKHEITHILNFIEQTDKPFAKSYALLFIGAVLDVTNVPKETCKLVTNKLIDVLCNLKTYNVFDSQKRFVHTLSHAIFLAESLLQKLPNDRQNDVLQAILHAYLRADTPFMFNEDVLLANLLVQFVISKEVASGMTEQLSLGLLDEEDDIEIFTQHEFNKRLLWMSLRVVSSDESVFHNFTETLRQDYLELHL